MDNFDSVEDFVSTTFEPSLVSNVSRVSVIEEIVTEKNNFSDCPLLFSKVPFLLPSFPFNMMYACLAVIFFNLSIVLNVVVMRFYKKPHTCNRTYVFGLVYRDTANTVYKLLPLLILMRVQECRLMMAFYKHWLLAFYVGLFFEFTPGCYIILDRFFHLYLPTLVKNFFNFKCAFLISHVLIFGFYLFSVYTRIKFAIVSILLDFAFGLSMFLWFATFFVIIGFDLKILKNKEIEPSNSQDAAEIPG